jgi:plastocyanin
MKKALLITIVLLVAAFLAHIASGASAKPLAPDANDKATYTITIKDFMFTPRDLRVPAGSKVTWVNKDEEPHTVVEVNQAFTSKAMDTDDGFTYQFKTAGTYKFFCTLHPRMTGSVTVEAK